MAGLARDWKRRSAGKAVMRAASRGIRPRQGVARFEISDVQTLFWRGDRGCGQQALLPALLAARYGGGNRLFPGEIVVTEMQESLQVVDMDCKSR